MTDFLKLVAASILGGLIVVGGQVAFSGVAFGASPPANLVKLAGGTAAVQIGSSGSAVRDLILTSCDMLGAGVTHVSSTTLPYSCAVTGVTSTFKVLAQFSSTTVPTTRTGGFSIVASRASTTNGYVEVMVFNSGPSATLSGQSMGSSTAIQAWRNQ